MKTYTQVKYNCRRATFLIEKKQQRRLSIGELIELRIHLLTCPLCRIYKKQTLVITQLIRSIFKHNTPDNSAMPPDSKAEIQKRVDAELNK